MLVNHILIIFIRIGSEVAFLRPCVTNIWSVWIVWCLYRFLPCNPPSPLARCFQVSGYQSSSFNLITNIFVSLRLEDPRRSTSIQLYQLFSFVPNVNGIAVLHCRGWVSIIHGCICDKESTKSTNRRSTKVRRLRRSNFHTAYLQAYSHSATKIPMPELWFVRFDTSGQPFLWVPTSARTEPYKYPFWKAMLWLRIATVGKLPKVRVV